MRRALQLTVSAKDVSVICMTPKASIHHEVVFLQHRLYKQSEVSLSRFEASKKNITIGVSSLIVAVGLM